MATKLKLICAFLKFLQSEPKSEDGEGLELVSQLLGEAYNITPDVMANNDVKFVLTDIFDAGLQTLSAQTQQVTTDEKLKNFMEVLKSKGYFNNVVEGSQEYIDRYNKAKEKFLGRTEQSSEMSDEQKKAIAEKLKEEGNQKLKSNDLQGAIECYTKAIQMNPQNAIYYANRAAAYTMLRDYESTVADCKLAIEVDPKYSKAHSRMGAAYFMQGKNKESVDCFTRALELDPNNASYKRDLENAQRKLASSAPQMPNLGGMNIEEMMSNPQFVNFASNMMKQPGFNDIVSNLMGNMGQGGDMSQMFANMQQSLGAMGMPSFNQQQEQEQEQEQVEEAEHVHGEHCNHSNDEAPALPGFPGMPPGMSPEVLRDIQNDPRIKENPRMQAIMEDVRANGPAAIMKYMSDPEFLQIASTFAQQLFGNQGGSNQGGQGGAGNMFS